MNILDKALLRMRRKRAFRLVNGRLAGSDCFEKKAKLLRKAGFSIGKGTKIVGPITITTTDFSVGENCWIGAGFQVFGNGKVTIGDCCDIAPNVHLHTGGHFIGDSSRRAGEGLINQISVESGCWLCAEVKIVNSVKIESGSIVAPGAVVIRDVSANTMVGGVPAKMIKELDP